MRHLRVALITTTSFLAVQCAVVPKPQNRNTNTPVNHKEVDKTISQQIEIPHQPEFVTPIKADLDDTPREEVPIVATVPLSTFTRLELEHIKFADYDPFPNGNDIFVIDLNKASETFTYPLTNGKFSSGYGMRGRSFHSGVDLLEEVHTPIYAAFDGVVRISKPYSGYGNVIVLRHDNGIETVYGHNTKNLVKAGDKVKSGDHIATVGRTGYATANHLHFEVRVLGQTINPALLIDVHNRQLQKGVLEVRRSGAQITASNTKSDITESIKPKQPEKQVAVATTAPSKNPSSTTTTSKVSSYHTVVKGDTLYGISRKYGSSVSAICKLNNITEKTVLALGRKLRVR